MDAWKKIKRLEGKRENFASKTVLRYPKIGIFLGYKQGRGGEVDDDRNAQYIPLSAHFLAIPETGNYRL